MAKNKNRERKQQQQQGRGPADRNAGQAQGSSTDEPTQRLRPEGSPSAPARKDRKQSFGHN